MYIIDRIQTNRGDIREFFRNDSALRHYWPLRKDNIDYVGGNHFILNNTVFNDVGCAFNGINSTGATTNAINLTVTQKCTVLLDWLPTFDLINIESVLEFSVNGLTNAGGFGFATLGNSIPNNAVQLYTRGNAGTNDGRWTAPDYIFTKGVLMRLALNIDYTQGVAGETQMYINGAYALKTTQALVVNNNGNLGNFVLYIGARAASSLFSQCIIRNLAIFTRILSQREVYEYYQWSNNDLTNDRVKGL